MLVERERETAQCSTFSEMAMHVINPIDCTNLLQSRVSHLGLYPLLLGLFLKRSPIRVYVSVYICNE